ncbi:MAG: tyrosine-type recombinase/integrase [Telluria sp.]
MAELTHPDASLPRLPPNLDGHHGSNRGRHGIRQIVADTDIEAFRIWLAEYASSPHTLRSYRKEALRLLIWATRMQRKPVSSLTREDLLAYEVFLTSPPADWVDAERPRHGADRRLFAGPLSPRSVRQAMGILSGLFNYLVAAGYLAGSPLALRRQRNHGVSRRSAVERYLSQDLWQFVLDFIDTLPQATVRDRQHYERARWLFRLLYGAALRASEVAQAKAGDLYQRRGRWWLAVVGKGGVAGDIPIGEALMADFARYREFHRLPGLPLPDESTPLVMSIAGATDRPLTATSIYLVVKEVFRRAADALESRNPAGATTLRNASTHWLRHTSASHQADAGNDIRHIQKNLRHASIETTAIYLHAEDDRRHAETTGTRRRDA